MSKTKLRSAKFSINELVKQTTGHSFASQADMRCMLFRCIKDLHELGFKVGHIRGLQSKHIHVLVDHWKAQGKNPATIKNYMSKLRKTALLLDNPNLLKPDNAIYKLEKRSYAPLHNKAIYHIDLSTCTDPHIRLSLEGQALFGLRREESMKFTLSEALQGNTIKIMPSWTKGGIGRVLNITNNAQQEWLNKIAGLVKHGESLIPSERSYRQQLSRYQAKTEQMGLSKLHGLRHAYAQRRYRELTIEFDRNKLGLLCPIEGGKTYKTMTAYEKTLDRKARQIISRELGHSRINIVKIYIG